MSRSARFIGFIVILFVILFPLKVRATITSCTASVSSPSAPSGSAATLVFTVTNGGDGAANWVKIERPSSNFSVTGGSADGWTLASSDEQSITLTTNNLLASGQSVPVSVDITSVDTQAGAQSWIASMDDAGGGSAATCGGDTGVSIAPVTQPGISLSNLVVSDVTDTSVKVTWDTDGSANSSVDYGTDSNYGSNTSDGTMGTSHSITLSGLSSNTTYHYDAKSSDGNGNTTDSGDNSFVTAQTGSSGTTQTGTVTTTTRVTGTTPKPTPTPIPDTFPPKVSVVVDFTKPFKVAPTISGHASDPSGVAKLEYSYDGGESWQPVDEFASPGSTNTAFSFLPSGLLDDNYNMQVRATDGKGNAGVTDLGTMVIDRLPPRIGGYLISLGPDELAPSADGTYTLINGLDYKITLSSVGGPVNIDLNYIDNQHNPQKISLTKNPDNGLWIGTLHFDSEGTYDVSFYAIDGAQNISEHSLTRISVVTGGRVTVTHNSPMGDAGRAVGNGEVSAYYLDDATKQFTLWDGSPFGQNNPVALASNGRYALYMPAGTYYLRVTAPGFKQLVTSIFTIDRLTPILSDFTLVHARVIVLGPFIIPLPDFSQTTANVQVGLTSSTNSVSASTIIGQEFPYFSLKNDSGQISSLTLRGKPTIISFIPTWLPQAASQFATLQGLALDREINVLVVVPQESVSSVSILAKRAGYTFPIVADPDGDLIESLGFHTFPTHVVVNRKGVVTSVNIGLYEKNQLFDMMVM
ncbi:MAG TPA: redoxin domain-containing protein [Patescibacteria group bacterium]|nr:redoxin domain-containing protein [Patescibacteria group bacterium]